jgi:hypothetical protein
MSGFSGNDAYIFAKYTAAAGALSVVKRVGNSSNLFGSIRILADGSGNVFLYGTVNAGSAIDMDPGAGTATVGNVNEDRGVVAKYDSSLNIVFANQLRETSNSGAWVDAMAINQTTGEYYLYGNCGGSAGAICDFDMTSGGSSLVTMTGDGSYLAKFASTGAYSSMLSQINTGGASNPNVGDMFVDSSQNLWLSAPFNSSVSLTYGSALSLTGINGAAICFKTSVGSGYCGVQGYSNGIEGVIRPFGGGTVGGLVTVQSTTALQLLNSSGQGYSFSLPTTNYAWFVGNWSSTSTSSSLGR